MIVGGSLGAKIFVFYVCVCVCGFGGDEVKCQLSIQVKYVKIYFIMKITFSFIVQLTYVMCNSEWFGHVPHECHFL